MPSEPEFLPQERSDTCALACLRMLLAFRGISKTEDELIRAASMQEGGVDIEELGRLAVECHLPVKVSELTLRDIVDAISDERFSIVYLNRLPMDKVFAIHAVVPVRVSKHYVTILDPRRGRRRVSRRIFETCRRYLAFVGVIEA